MYCLIFNVQISLSILGETYLKFFFEFVYQVAGLSARQASWTSSTQIRSYVLDVLDCLWGLMKWVQSTEEVYITLFADSRYIKTTYR